MSNKADLNMIPSYLPDYMNTLLPPCLHAINPVPYFWSHQNTANGFPFEVNFVMM